MAVGEGSVNPNEGDWAPADDRQAGRTGQARLPAGGLWSLANSCFLVPCEGLPIISLPIKTLSRRRY